MKKKNMIIIILVLLFSLTSCASDSEKVANNTQTQDVSETKKMVEEEKATEETKETTSSEVEETENTAETTSGDQAETSDELVVDLDANLTGLELLKSIRYTIPKSIKTVTESVAADGTTSIITMYQKGEYIRYESQSDVAGLQISIYNADQGALYMFGATEANGVVTYDDENDESVAYEDADYSEIVLSDEIESYSAEVVTENGVDLVHVKTVQSDGNEGTIEIQMWYSPLYAVVMKYNLYMNGNQIGSSSVIDYEVDIKINDDMFLPPENIVFSEW